MISVTLLRECPPVFFKKIVHSTFKALERLYQLYNNHGRKDFIYWLLEWESGIWISHPKKANPQKKG